MQCFPSLVIHISYQEKLKKSKKFLAVSLFDSFLINFESLPHLRLKDFGVAQEVLAEHFDDEVELTQVLPLLCDFKPHQVVIGELPGGRRLLCALRH